ncbi:MULTISPECIES: hypothetical protein [Phenylobacterium]|uniref:Uncharacterized protein n=1 Tax=Phenylobacterium koreense TaxID=266125 RepID=A0ABV2EMQ2_9CAUL
MKPEKEPEVIDLAQRRKALQAREAAAKAAREKAERMARSGGSVIGGRKHAGWILLAVVLVLLALYVAPRFF